LRLPAPKSTARNDFVFSIYCCGIQADIILTTSPWVQARVAESGYKKLRARSTRKRKKLTGTEKKQKEFGRRESRSKVLIMLRGFMINPLSLTGTMPMHIAQDLRGGTRPPG
jgi:hypothetical protein